MGKINDLTGLRFGKLIVVKHTGRKRIMYWECLCDCGRTTTSRGGDLKLGKITSCGCSRYLKLKVRNTKHGKHGTRIYRIWRGIISRCEIKSATSYNNYGGRGINVCDNWHDFATFYEWSLGSGYSDTLTIERLNVNGNYSPENCCWVLKSDQSKNQRMRISLPKRNSKGQFCKDIN